MCAAVQLLLSAAQPTDQGEESVVLLVIVLVGGLHVLSSHPCTVKKGASRVHLLSFCHKSGESKVFLLPVLDCHEKED